MISRQTSSAITLLGSSRKREREREREKERKTRLEKKEERKCLDRNVLKKGGIKRRMYRGAFISFFDWIHLSRGEEGGERARNVRRTFVLAGDPFTVRFTRAWTKVSPAPSPRKYFRFKNKQIASDPRSRHEE